MMGSVCADEQQQQYHHMFHHPYLIKKSLREIDIPPRKLLTRGSPDVFSAMDSPNKLAEENSAFSKFLPNNKMDGDGDGEDDSDPYSSDHFRMYEFKVRKCNRSRSHDWTDCPFTHPGEKARRRDPRKYHYSGTVCSEFRKGHCSKGDNCEFSHGVFECWLHPSRYRTEACKDGKNCKRKVCFFAHSARQLRILPETSPDSPPPAENKYACNALKQYCCVFCHSMATTASPTSTLRGVSPPASPPFSPVCSPDLFSLYGSVQSGGVSYKDALTELMASLEGMNLNQEAVPPRSAAAPPPKLSWLDVNFNVTDDQPQFVLSPSTPTLTPTSGRHGGSKFFTGDASDGRNLMEESNSGGPDLGWVNDLLT